MLSGVETGGVHFLHCHLEEVVKYFISLSRDGDVAGACDGTALVLLLVSDSCSSTDGLGKTVSCTGFDSSW
jgi:hypothetical protein